MLYCLAGFMHGRFDFLLDNDTRLSCEVFAQYNSCYLLIFFRNWTFEVCGCINGL